MFVLFQAEKEAQESQPRISSDRFDCSIPNRMEARESQPRTSSDRYVGPIPS